MSEILYWLYELPRQGFGNEKIPRRGALLYVDGGLSDLCPLVDFGDPDVETQLRSLKQGEPLPLIQRSLQLALIDSLARKEGRSLLQEGESQRNHFLLTGSNWARVTSDFASVKIKIGFDAPTQAVRINSWVESNPQHLRLDCNAHLTLATFFEFYNCLSDLAKSRIEFVEDPTPYDPIVWNEIQQLLPVACDFESEQVDWNHSRVPFSVLVWKPARLDIDTAKDRAQRFQLSVVVTSALDHVVGSMHALAQALVLKKNSSLNIRDAGCLSWAVPVGDRFSQQVKVSGSRIWGAPGTGVGFDDVIGDLSWKKL